MRKHKNRPGPGVRSGAPWVIRALLGLLCCCQQANADPLSTLKSLPLEELMRVEVSIVSKAPLALADSPAAVHVITSRQISQSAADNLPDLLRMVPGLSVARIDANKWAVTSRGFNNELANKLLVMIDGRSVYTPLFSGTFWGMNDLLLEDIERIEVIRGPGASVWGANAVNGVINIVTKNAADTTGTLLSASLGSEQRQGGARSGGALADNGHYRVYAKYRNQDDSVFVGGGDASDHWDDTRGGFRLDWRRGADTFQLQGDAYRGDFGDSLPILDMAPPDFSRVLNDQIDVAGSNLLLRWGRRQAPGIESEFQAYLDYNYRQQWIIEERRKTLDLSYQQARTNPHGNQLVWGLGYRLGMDHLPDGDTARGQLHFFTPKRRQDQLFSTFAQYDHPLLAERLWLTLGSKLEHNDYSGFEVQPSVRLRWKPGSDSLLWAALSRAVRTPSRAEHDILFPLFLIDEGPPPTMLTLVGNRDFEAEELLAWEVGYRFHPRPDLAYDLALFYNDYDQLQTLEPAGFIPLPIGFPAIGALVEPANRLRGDVYGLELAVNWSPTPDLSLQASYSFLEMELHAKAGSLDPLPEINEGFSPEQQLGLLASYQLSDRLALHVWTKYTDRLPRLEIGDYVQLDSSLQWSLSPATSVTLGGRNLLNPDQRQFSSGVVPSEIEREFFIRLVHRYPG